MKKVNNNPDPRIHLGIDNCFAIKRWVTPFEWGRVIKEMGLKYIEAVPDLECEPLFTPQDYRDDWVDEVLRMQQSLDMKVVMLYSNDSTYDTIGLSHPDARVREHLVNKWFAPFIDMAAAIQADVGYYVQATPESMLYSHEGRSQAYANALSGMVQINKMAAGSGIQHVALEQMYTPHQPPFTIDGMRKLMLEVSKASGSPLYLTEDVGHHCQLYLRPSINELQAASKKYSEDGLVACWLASEEAVQLFCKASQKGYLSDSEIKRLQKHFDDNPDQFSKPEDNDCYAWLSRLGGWSPVIHLQQTNGTHSSHEPFLEANNARGIIHPVKVLQALSKCYNSGADPDMPAMCEDIYLVQELYISTREIGYQGLHKMRRSTEYLRKFIPEDGMRLSELLAMHSEAEP